MSFHGFIVHFFIALNMFVVGVCLSLFIHSPAERYLDSFQVLEIINKVTLSIYGMVFMQILVFNTLRCVFGLHIKSMLCFITNYQIVFENNCSTWHSHQQLLECMAPKVPCVWKLIVLWEHYSWFPVKRWGMLGRGGSYKATAQFYFEFILMHIFMFVFSLASCL